MGTTESPKTLSGGLQGQNRFCNNAKTSFAFDHSHSLRSGRSFQRLCEGVPRPEVLRTAGVQYETGVQSHVFSTENQ